MSRKRRRAKSSALSERWEALVLAAALRMIRPGMDEPDAELGEPDAEPGPGCAAGIAPRTCHCRRTAPSGRPWRRKMRSSLARTVGLLLVGAGLQAGAEARMIVDQGQRVARASVAEPDPALEVHLPEQIGRLLLEAPCGRRARRPGQGSAPWRDRIAWTVDTAGTATPCRARPWAILRAPQAGCASRRATTRASSAAGLRSG